MAGGRRRVVIVARDIRHRDAVGNFCRQSAALLVEAGYRVALAAENCDPDDRAAIWRMPSALGDIEPGDVVFFHFSTYDPALPALAALPNAKILYFHNITPPALFVSADESSRALVEAAESQRRLATSFDVLMANSQMTASALAAALEARPEAGDRPRRIVCCPPVIHPRRWHEVVAEPADLPACDRFVLYVGRLAPHKGVGDLLGGFAEFARADRRTALVLVGADGPDAAMLQARVVADDALRDRVAFHHDASDGMLRYLYERAALCASMSLHEGFGVPIFDALVFGRPLLIRAEDGMMETAGEAALRVDAGEPGRPTFAAVALGLARALNDSGERERQAAARPRRVAALSLASDGQLILECVAAAEALDRARSL